MFIYLGNLNDWLWEQITMEIEAELRAELRAEKNLKSKKG